MDGIAIALIGVCGTLAGTLLGWVLNSQSYKIGKTKIYAVLVESINMGTLSLDGSEQKGQSGKSVEYIIRCIASNSRQIPVILDRFSVVMKLDRKSKPTVLSALEPEIEYSDFGRGKIGVQLVLQRQLIQPHTLHEFSFKVNYEKPDIKYSRLELVAHDEKNKRCKFLLHDGLKIKKHPYSIPESSGCR